MSGETSWFERALIALSESDLNLLNKYNSVLTRKLHSAQKCSDKDLTLFLANKRKLFRDFRAETYIPANIISEDSKKESKTASGSKVSLYLLCLSYLHTDTMKAKLTLKLITEVYSSKRAPRAVLVEFFIHSLLLDDVDSVEGLFHLSTTD